MRKFVFRLSAVSTSLESELQSLMLCGQSTNRALTRSIKPDEKRNNELEVMNA